MKVFEQPRSFQPQKSGQNNTIRLENNLSISEKRFREWLT